MLGLTPANSQALRVLLQDLFHLSEIQHIELVYDRYRCLNYKVSTPTDVFFLKQYRGRSSEDVFETKFAERYFARQGLPIVESLQDQFGRPAFLFDGDWYSLFPFISARQPDPAFLSDEFLSSLGQELARLHQVGSLVRLDSFRRLRLWNVEQFMFEMVDLKSMLDNERSHPGIPPLVLETMEKKVAFVAQTGKTPEDFHLPFNCLLHGDPIYQNTFIDDDDHLMALFDLEDACIGPRAYEVGRAILINCFEDGWGKEQFRRAHVFLSSYQRVFPLLLDELAQGLEMYSTKNAHKLWFEGKHLFEENDETRRCYEAHARRVDHVYEDWHEFCRILCSSG